MKISIRSSICLALFIGAAGRPPLPGQDLEISEFLAVNDGGLVDEDGDHSDWIEVHNRGPTEADLGGWHLTDDPQVLARWTFPGRKLGAGEFLVVFASGKDRALAGAPLHTNFQLDGDGEYLALVAPDVRTVAHQFAPRFPPQRRDISFGAAEEFTARVLVGPGAASRRLVPADGRLGLDWTLADFPDSSWKAGAGGIGFDLDDHGPPSPDGGTNLARGGIASQSSTGFAGFASRAIDGKTDGVYANASVTQTSPTDEKPWWQVDLRAAYPLHRIVLWNRTDCCAERLTNFRVAVLDDQKAVVASSDHFTDLSFPEAADTTILLAEGTAGRYVRVEKLGPDRNGDTTLSLAEVQVFQLPAGYRGLIDTDVEEEMSGRSASMYLRWSFDLPDPTALDYLKLSVKYDDGLVALLNGREVARRNAPPLPAYDSAASNERPDAEALFFEDINISEHRDALRPGANVLAIHGLNLGPSDRDFLVVPELRGSAIHRLGDRYFTRPSPGSANPAEGFLALVAAPRIGVDRGFFDRPIDVEIACDTPGAAIRFTLDGSAPTSSAGSLYSAPLRIDRTATLRAAAFKDGLLDAPVESRTYIFTAEVVKQNGAGFPATWGGTPADYEMDPNVVNDPRYRATLPADLKTIPTLSIVMDPKDIFGPNGLYSHTEERGAAWERPCSMELIYPDGREGVQADCGLRIFGYGWRSHSATMKHALRLMFKSRYGPSHLHHRMFPEFPEVEDFDDLVLRAQGSRSWNDFRPSIEQTCYVRDAWARSTERDMGKMTTSSTYVQLYLNGLYWGLYNPVERPDAEFMRRHLGGEEADYDALNARTGTLEVIDGSREDWDRLIALARGDVSTLEAYRRIGELIDIPDLIDYMLINFYTVNQDWVGSNGNNMRVAGAPALGIGFKSFCWDMEYSIWEATDNNLAVRTDFETPALVYARLKLNPEFRLQFADRVHRHLFNGGALTPEKTAGRWMRLAGQIDRAVVGESARWGDRRREPPYTRDVEWVRERDRLMSSYFPRRTAILLEQLKAAGLYPSLAAPEFNRPGGPIDPGFLLTAAAPAGTILYTVDGTDPREPGGAVAPGALTYSGAVELVRTTRVSARARSGVLWSALSEGLFVMDASNLRITEVMYHPAPPPAGSPFDAEDFEFIELKNIGGRPIALAGVELAGGIQLRFAGGEADPGLALAPGALTLAVRSIAAFESRYGPPKAPIAGQYGGRLSNGGDSVAIRDAAGGAILEFIYRDDWYPSTDGGGRSLVAVDPAADPATLSSGAAWRSSRVSGGTPGENEAPPIEHGQVPGDANGDGALDLSDPLGLLGVFFGSRPAGLPCGSGGLDEEANRLLQDSNGDGRADIADVVHVLRYLFLSGPGPALGPDCRSVESCPNGCGR